MGRRGALRERWTSWWVHAEPHVMGRAAVAVVVACLQVPAWAQLLTPVAASQAIDNVGPSALAYIWAGSIVLAGVLMVAAYLVRDPEAERVVEVASLSIVSIVCCIYVAAVVETAGLVGALYLIATLIALVVNSMGRAVLLVRQIVTARALAREANG